MKPGGLEAAALSRVERDTAAPWRAVAAVLALLLPALLWLYHDTGLAMVAIWSRSDTFAHCVTVPPIVAWLIWRQRDALAAQPPRPAPAWLLPIAVAALAWLLGDLAAANAVAQLAFTALLVLTFVAVAGMRAARQVLFPLCFLFFAVPVGEFLMPQFMVWTADFTVLALRLSGIPVFREGLNFVIPSGNWSVVEACSGIRYLIASFMVGTLFAYLNYRSLKRRLVFSAVALLVPVVANWVRAYGIVLLGHVSGNQLAVGADHLLYGWVFFGIVIMMMFMIGARWAEPDVEPAPQAMAPAADAPALPAAARRATVAGDRTSRRVAVGVALAAWLIAALPQAVLPVIVRGEAGAVPALVAPPMLAGGWQRVDAGDRRGVAWQPAFEPPAAQLAARYAAPAGEVGLSIGYYRQQRDGSKLVSSQNVLVPSRDRNWARLAEGERHVDAAAARAGDSLTPASRWRTTVLSSRSPAGGEQYERLAVWQLYWVNGRWTDSDAAAKAWGGLYRLLGRGDDGAVIVLHVPHAATEAAARNADNLLAAFARDNLPAIDALLRGARAAATAGASSSNPIDSRSRP